MKKVDLKEEIIKNLDSKGIYHILGYFMSKTTGLDKEKCLEFTKAIAKKKIDDLGKDFVNISNSKHKLSELSNEDLLKDNDKIIKG
tara:strand:- start:541 stop:798 length:258 start_codon:yes stop_codon:yes gene_type:complete